MFNLRDGIIHLATQHINTGIRIVIICRLLYNSLYPPPTIKIADTKRNRNHIRQGDWIPRIYVSLKILLNKFLVYT